MSTEIHFLKQSNTVHFLKMKCICFRSIRLCSYFSATEKKKKGNKLIILLQFNELFPVIIDSIAHQSQSKMFTISHWSTTGLNRDSQVLLIMYEIHYFSLLSRVIVMLQINR